MIEMQKTVMQTQAKAHVALRKATEDAHHRLIQLQREFSQTSLALRHQYQQESAAFRQESQSRFEATSRTYESFLQFILDKISVGSQSALTSLEQARAVSIY